MRLLRGILYSPLSKPKMARREIIPVSNKVFYLSSHLGTHSRVAQDYARKEYWDERYKAYAQIHIYLINIYILFWARRKPSPKFSFLGFTIHAVT